MRRQQYSSTAMFKRIIAGGAFAAAALSMNAPRMAAQQPTADPRDTTHAQTQAPFFTRKDAFLAAGFAVGTVLMFPLDEHIAQHIHGDSNATNYLSRLSKATEAITSPGSFLIGGSLYLVGLVGHYDRVEDIGWHGTEAVLLADGVTYVLKGLGGRARPYVSNDLNAHDFSFGRGFGKGDDQSFPSGHSTTAFAAAAAVTNETSRWWPHSTWIVGPLMYGGATAVALSRMYHNKHWASDVVLGAAIGTFSGRKVVQYSHGHPHNPIDRFILRTSVVPDGFGGIAVAYTAPIP
jgi:membrane-associated phospholipid phosphatase